MDWKPEGGEGVGTSSDGSRKGNSRIFPVHQQCNSRAEVGYSLPENRKRRKEAEVAVQATQHERKETATRKADWKSIQKGRRPVE